MSQIACNIKCLILCGILTTKKAKYNSFTEQAVYSHGTAKKQEKEKKEKKIVLL